MRDIVLDGQQMTTHESAFSYLKETLGLPDYFGNNLDALNDSLREMREVNIRFHNPAALLRSLGLYGVQMLQVFAFQAQDRPDFNFRIVNRG